MNLQLSLKTKWFEMTKAGVKTEDYREINDYWCRRLLKLEYELEYDAWLEMIEILSNTKQFDSVGIEENMEFFGVKFKGLDTNTITLGYPSASDKDRILKLEHKGIEIRTGNPEWGAEPNKLYFVIKHGKRI